MKNALSMYKWLIDKVKLKKVNNLIDEMIIILIRRTEYPYI